MSGDIQESPPGLLKRLAMNQNEEKRRIEDVWQFRLLEKYGLPTMFAVVLLAFVLNLTREQMNQIQKEREQFRVVLNDISQSIRENTQVIRVLSDKVEHQGESIAELRRMRSRHGTERLTVSLPSKISEEPQ